MFEEEALGFSCAGPMAGGLRFRSGILGLGLRVKRLRESLGMKVESFMGWGPWVNVDPRYPY